MRTLFADADGVGVSREAQITDIDVVATDCECLTRSGANSDVTAPRGVAKGTVGKPKWK